MYRFPNFDWEVAAVIRFDFSFPFGAIAPHMVPRQATTANA